MKFGHLGGHLGGMSAFHHHPLPRADSLLPVVGAAMAPVVGILRLFSALDETLLLTGPTGTGKSHLARWSHAQSVRRDRPFVVVQLHSLPEGVREGALFGWRRGAFTGAVSDHVGSVERAEGGTLFIDEVDKLSLQAQSGLLRILEDRRYHPIGDGQERSADVRFIVATNACLEREVAEGRFLEDLYYRIHVLPIDVPPLSRRLDELGGWAAVAVGRSDAGLDAPAERLLRAYPWPGNLRQYRSVILRAHAFAGGGTREAAGISEEHVRCALAMEARVGRVRVLDTLREAAQAFVVESASREAEGHGALCPGLAQAFTGLVLEAAIARFGSERAAFLHFGLEGQLRGGNHLKTWRRERERVGELRDALRLGS